MMEKSKPRQGMSFHDLSTNVSQHIKEPVYKLVQKKIKGSKAGNWPRLRIAFDAQKHEP